jgi:diguanylate cyclase (GGDEF)-like protein
VTLPNSPSTAAQTGWQAGGEAWLEAWLKLTDEVIVLTESGRLVAASTAARRWWADAVARGLPDVRDPSPDGLAHAACTGAPAQGWSHHVLAQRPGAVLHRRRVADDFPARKPQHDSLTGFPERARFLAQAETVIAGARAKGQRVALLFVDIDHFKRVNDSLGYRAGDAVLQTLAQRITGTLRANDLVGRLSGDEFMVLLDGDPHPDDVQEVADKLLAAIDQPVPLDGGSTIRISASIGVAVAPQHGGQADELLRHADTAMMRAKSRGGSGSAFFEPDMAREAHEALRLESDLGQALAEGQFELAYQPQVRHGDQALVGVEALVRWHHPQRGWVKPDDFIELAEQRRLMLGIGQWVLTEAIRQSQVWRRAGLLSVRVGVNLSAMQFRGGGFVEWVRQALGSAQAEPTALELELTERMIMDDLPDGRQSLQALRALGVHVALDDFGTGTTSLGQLKTLEVDRLKIDRSFVRDLPDDAASAALAKAIIQLADGLGLDLVAEGVEHQAQWDWLAAHGCPQVQGHLVALPMSAEAFGRWLAARSLNVKA